MTLRDICDYRKTKLGVKFLRPYAVADEGVVEISIHDAEGKTVSVVLSDRDTAALARYLESR
jgi:hypothetical protein